MRYALVGSLLFLISSLNAGLSRNDLANLKTLEKQFKNQQNKIQNGIDDQSNANVTNFARLAFWGGISVAVFGMAESNKNYIASGIFSAFASYFPYYFYKNEALCQWKHNHPRKMNTIFDKLTKVEEGIEKRNLQNCGQGKKLLNQVQQYREYLENLCDKCKKS